MEGLLWAAGIIIAVFAFLSTFQSVTDLIYKVLGLTRMQPKLAINLISNGKGRTLQSNVTYLPSSFKDDEPVSFDRQHELIHDYFFFWDYELIITNQADFPAIGTRLSQVVGISTSIVFVDDSIDKTIPFVFNVSKSYKIRFTRIYRCDLMQAKDVLSKKPFTTLMLQYTNLEGIKYYTQFTNDNCDIINNFGKERKV